MLNQANEVDLGRRRRGDLLRPELSSLEAATDYVLSELQGRRRVVQEPVANRAPVSVLRQVEALLDRLWIRILTGSHCVTVLPEEFLVASGVGHHGLPAGVELSFLDRVLGGLLHLGLRRRAGHQGQPFVRRELAVRGLGGLGDSKRQRVLDDLLDGFILKSALFLRLLGGRLLGLEARLDSAVHAAAGVSQRQDSEPIQHLLEVRLLANDLLDLCFSKLATELGHNLVEHALDALAIEVVVDGRCQESAHVAG